MKADFQTVKSAAIGRWPEILTYNGISAEYLNTKHGPCPGCGGKDRFRYLDDDDGGWICGQGGIATGGDGFNLLVHIGYSKSGALQSVAQYLNVENVSLSPKQRDELAERRRIATQTKYEATLSHEMHVLMQIVNPRISWRANSSNQNYRTTRPEVSQPPDEHLHRELEAVTTIKYLLEKLYGEVA
jgi:phage/plasmid primase-like uncharacterized protein